MGEALPVDWEGCLILDGLNLVREIPLGMGNDSQY